MRDFGEDLHWKFPESSWRVSGVFLRVSERCRRVPRGTPVSFWRGFAVEFVVVERIFIGFHDVGEDFQSLSMIVGRISIGLHDFGEDFRWIFMVWRGFQCIFVILERISMSFLDFGDDFQ